MDSYIRDGGDDLMPVLHHLVSRELVGPNTPQLLGENAYFRKEVCRAER